MIKFGIIFSKPLEVEDPLSQLGKKRPVYLRLLELCQKEGWETYVLTRKTYQGKGVFIGAWLYKDGNLERVNEEVTIDVVYDRTAGHHFPIENDPLVVIDDLDFKRLCWNKWEQYNVVGEYMTKTLFLGTDRSKLSEILDQVSTELVVIKPINGLKGKGIYIGDKKGALEFPFKDIDYIVQEFIDTKGGIPGITSGRHDLRVAITNHIPVWCHVRVPPKDSFLANAALGGNLTEIDYETVPESVKEIVKKVSAEFSKKYDNPIYSLDFGISEGRPYIFEINDTIGFPTWEMKNRDVFLSELVKNFKSKLV